MNVPFVRYKNFGRSLFRFITIHASVRHNRQTDWRESRANTALHSRQRSKKCHRHVSFGST